MGYSPIALLEKASALSTSTNIRHIGFFFSKAYSYTVIEYVFRYLYRVVFSTILQVFNLSFYTLGEKKNRIRYIYWSKDDICYIGV